MITPNFQISQTDRHIIIRIKALNALASDSEISAIDNTFTFYAKPYYLRLHLPGDVLDVDENNLEFEPETSYFKVILEKSVEGTHFENLELLTSLLAPKAKPVKKPIIEVLDNVCTDDIDEFNWEMDQTIQDDSQIYMAIEHKFGFANNYSDIFLRFQGEINNIIDVSEPHRFSNSIRFERKLKIEENDFSDDHYLADLYENSHIQYLIDYKCSWQFFLGKKSQIMFSESEREKLIKLPNREYLLDNSTKCALMLGLLDIMYAFAYDARTTQEDETSESAWTIRKLSSTLSWLVTFSGIKMTVNNCVRRSLCYPLYRNWNLSMKVLQDCIEIFDLGQIFIIKCLLKIQDLFLHYSDYYILNEIFINDYIIWIQSLKPKAFISFAEALKNVTIEKCNVNLDLELTELSAKLALEDS